MKTSLMSLIAFIAAVLLMAGTQGCYTQVGSTRDEQVYDNEQAENEAPADSETGEEGEYDENAVQAPADAGQDWTCQMHMGFDYYYPNTWWPSVGFSFAYNDPWYGWGYPSYGYGYGYGYGYPYYGYGYPYYPYYPWYDPWYGYPGYWYPTDPIPWQNREFGATRGSGSTRGPRGVNASNSDMRGGGVSDPQMMDLPSGSGRSVVGGTAGAAALKRGSTGATTQEPSSRSKGISRKDVTKKMEQKLSPGQRSARSSRDNSRLYRDRSSVSGSGRSRNNDSGPALNSTPPSGGASSRGGTGSSGGSGAPRNGGSSVRSAPPPSSAPAPRPSSPPPSSGGSRGGGGGGGRSPRP